jgi:hypothetical protein
MPVEIRELVIRAITTSDSVSDSDSEPSATTLVDQEEVIQACVKQVLKILKKEKER